MDKYNKLTCVAEPREVVLLKCIKENDALQINDEVLQNVTGELGALEVLTDGSCFELPEITLHQIKNLIDVNQIEKLYLQAYWEDRMKLDQMRLFFQIPIIFKLDITTFDNHFRNEVLKKDIIFSNVHEVKQYFDFPCVTVGIQGQSKESVAKDIHILLDSFKHSAVNVYLGIELLAPVDHELIFWFMREYDFLKDTSKIEFCMEDIAV